MKTLLNLLFPLYCAICQQKTGTEYPVCLGCTMQLPWLTQGCLRCATPQVAANLVCGQCHLQPPPFDRSFAAFYYRPPISDWIVAFKFHRALHLGSALGHYLSKQLQDHYSVLELPEAIIPIPLHRKRACARGYNQALEIARPIARSLHLPLLRFSCQRLRHTAEQTSLSAAKRQRNLRGAFGVSKPLPAYVAIVDDVMTTGTTVAAFAHCLKQHGVQRVDVWCLARADKERTHS